MLSINTNLSSLIAQNSLKTSTNKLNQAIERMTSGAKINHAKDNAANYSIATNMTTKLNAYMVAEDNCAMGLDLATTASSTLELICEHFTRIRDLAAQASNGTYGSESLNAVQTEINARLDEIKRIYASAEYNGVNYLKTEDVIAEEATNVPFLNQITCLSEKEALAQGYTLVSTADELINAINSNESICLTNDITINQTVYDTCIVNSYKNATIEGNGYTLNINRNLSNYPAQSWSFINEVSNITVQNLNMNYEGTFDYGFYGMAMTNSGKFTIDNCVFTGNVDSVYNFATIAYSNSGGGTIELKDSYANFSTVTAGTISGILSYGNSIFTSNYYFNNDVIADFTTEGSTTSSVLNQLLANAYDTKLIVPDNTKTTTLQIGINGESSSQIEFSTSFSLNIPLINCLTADSARNAITTIDSVLSKINDKQVEFGAVQNRLESALEAISVAYDNLVSSRSTIQDADIAELSSEYIRQQILQQASATLMATANQNPSIVLQLL